MATIQSKRKKQNEKNIITSVGDDADKLEPIGTTGGNEKHCSYYEKQSGRSSKTQIEHYHVIQPSHLYVFTEKNEK